MPPKFFKLPGKPAKKKSKAPVPSPVPAPTLPALVVSSWHSSTRPKKRLREGSRRGHFPRETTRSRCQLGGYLFIDSLHSPRALGSNPFHWTAQAANLAKEDEVIAGSVTTKVDLVSANATLVEECKSSAEVVATAIEESIYWSCQDGYGSRGVGRAPEGSPGPCLQELGTLPDHFAWEVAKPPEPYSPILLPSFDKEEYANQPAETSQASSCLSRSANSLTLALGHLKFMLERVCKQFRIALGHLKLVLEQVGK
ncbi:hypothetical protein Acr_08g0010050 [Actinidia rufa]|uniref:Uncharacterized protein n=1 Tax=Actinidia rufa TaxID=165716 RepID=A0A7J0F323_9ERIC|nr:hypothetical protein Acr_08g0010050 [Actinidia rufa]